jgi:tRNA pseudouridine38-40 synthase
MTYIDQSLDIELMQQGAKLFEGCHDFRRYCYKPGDKTQFVRSVSVSRVEPNAMYTASFFPEKSYLYRVKGSGFMRHQVRLMMGALFRLGKGSLSLEAIQQSLTGEQSELMGDMAPSSGLMLHQVHLDA